jgi:hypothetical protein
MKTMDLSPLGIGEIKTLLRNSNLPRLIICLRLREKSFVNGL